MSKRVGHMGGFESLVCRKKITILQFKKEYATKIGNTWKSDLLGYLSLGSLITILYTFAISEYLISIGFFILLLVLLYLNSKQEIKDIYYFAEKEGSMDARFNLSVDPHYTDNYVVNPYDPVINTGVMFITSDQKFEYIINHLTIKGMRIPSLRYLGSDEGKKFDGHNLFQYYFIPILITKSWKIYPMFDISALIEYKQANNSDRSEQEIFGSYRFAFKSIWHVKNYFEFDYSSNLKYDLTCEYGDITFTSQFAHGRFEPKLKPINSFKD